MQRLTPTVELDAALDRPLVDGDRGPAAALAMSIVVRMAEVSGARRLLSIEGAHIDSALYMGEATLAFAERLADLGARVAVPATLNVSGVDVHDWRNWAVPAEWAQRAWRQMQAYEKMGCRPTWTCAPYQESNRPRFGQQVAWGESNAIAFANSVLGARTERYPDLLDICAAITGRVPALGLHLDEHRTGTLLIELRGIPVRLQSDASFYPVLGHLVGGLAGDEVPVIEGLDAAPGEDDLKAFCAAAASSGAVALCHIVGTTPEAPTRAVACGGRTPARTLPLGMADLRQARAQLTTETGTRLDCVVLGSPHFSLNEFRALASVIAGRRKAAGVEFLVTASRAVRELARAAGWTDALEAFGGRVTVDTCILTSPMLPSSIETLMTNSAKYAYYAPGLLGTRVTFGSLADCVDSAVAGRVVRDDTVWNAR